LLAPAALAAGVVCGTRIPYFGRGAIRKIVDLIAMRGARFRALCAFLIVRRTKAALSPSSIGARRCRNFSIAIAPRCVLAEQVRRAC